jgi:uncharacterized protein YraI
MRRIALLEALCLLAGACGDDDAATTSSTIAPPTSTTAPRTTTTATSLTLPTTTTSTTAGGTSTTGTTYAWATLEVPEADLCVIEHRSGETLNVRSGPGTTYDVVGSLSFDQTGVHATGVGADDGGRVWKEIDYFGAPAWVASWLLTPNPCDLAAPADFCVTGTSCLERMNVRSGPGVAYQKLGSLPYDMVGVQATGASSADADGRTIGFLSCFGCHPVVCCAQTRHIHGDYCGVATNLLEREHPGSVGLFLQGAQGDVNTCVCH